MPKSKPKKPVVVLTTDTELIEYLKRQNVYSNPVEGFVDKDGHAWVTRRSKEAFERRKLGGTLPSLEDLDRIAHEEAEQAEKEAAELQSNSGATNA